MEKYDYSYNEIIGSLKKVGLKKGDKIFVHSNLGFFGKLRYAINPSDYYLQFKKAIFEIIGYEGTLIVPTFSYSFMNNEVFDIKKTPSVCGIFSEMVRKDEDSKRSDDPNFSISVIGNESEFFIENLPRHSFGNDSFWERFYKKNGKICNFNFDSGSTFFHYVEKILDVSYRYDKKFSGTSLKNNENVNETWIHFVFDHSKKNHWPNFEKFSLIAKKLKKTKIADLGKGQVTCIRTKEMTELIKKQLKINPSFLIEDHV